MTNIDFEVAYICDGKKCAEGCKTKAPDCTHTTDVRHAKSFTQMDENKYWEETQICNILKRNYIKGNDAFDLVELELDCEHTALMFYNGDQPLYCPTCGKLIEENEEYGACND